jgi:hypothetical protein
MVFKSDKGITLVEIVVTICVTVLFSLIAIADFPRILRQSALSRGAYKLSQDLRKIEDLSLSGVKIKDVYGSPIDSIKGYGVYIDLSQNSQYIMYADIADATNVSGSKTFDNANAKMCSEYNYNLVGGDAGDCKIEVTDLTKQNPSLYLKRMTNSSGDNITNPVSINFTPPNPIVDIQGDYPGVYIVLGLSSQTTERSVQVNASGLINVQ